MGEVVREIKFRVWDKFIDGWCKPDEVGIRADGAVLFEDYDSGEGSFWNANDIKDRFTICQFTGLHDRNGKEIYESDIVRWHRHGTNNPKSAIGEVKWESSDNFHAWWCIESDYDGFYGYECQEFSWSQLEVIGNIYEAPGLVPELPRE